MVGRKKAASSTAPKSTKQKTLLDLFPKKTVGVAVAQQPAPSPPSDPLPPSLVAPIEDDEPDPKVIHYISSSPEPGPVASTFKAETAPLKPPSRKTAPDKPPSSRSIKPASKGASRPQVIDLMLPSESPPSSATQPKIPKPTYSIFTSRPKLDGPLISDASPSTAPLPRPPKQKYSIFNPQPKKPPGPVSHTKFAIADTEVDAPFPNKDSQHVRGPQTAFSTSTHWKRLSRKVINDPPERFRPRLDVTEEGSRRTLSRVSAPSFWEKEKCVQDIPADHKQNHPAIARLAASVTSPPDAASSLEKLWSERWRPQRADGVLGNEQNTVYLRDWLRALEVRFEKPATSDSNNRRGKAPEDSRGAKRPQVMRSVARAKKRQRRSSDGFIVSDASDYASEVEGPVDTEGDDDDDFRPALLNDEPSPDEGASNVFGEHLANTIILLGPSGTGKTTAVYSCAEELGWEVFEVYPGIGKRNGASLETMIGEVGKNHLVRRTQVRGVFSRTRHAEVDPDNSDDFGFVTQAFKAGIRQSVILLEEVDILFKDDGSFWPAVVRFIKECKRAVILTCNNLSLVPTSELPLQTILEFQPCPAPVAGSYLQGLCCAEGHIVDRNVLTKMYAQGYDLRHTIHRLQLLCQGFPLGSRAELDQLLDWNAAPRQSVPHADLISFMDAYMTRGSLDQPPALALTRYEHGADDEMGFPILADALNDGYGIYEWDTRIIDAVLEGSRGTRVARERDRARDYEDLLDALRNNLAFPVGLMEREVAHTEYVPWVRQIIAGDDAAAVAHSAQRGAGRGTRNSARYIRSVELDAEGRRALEGSSLSG
ncbi:P-loop containing nucleoside triphosphate hydrolase protein [Mycena rosella]|uniref:P-loop containing nucleoside triphosphate hydrolase protein n=1 Tax=Mycena rosella TaxID=1033263 RepID=A0AAD7GL38_MYCRO|nr:P-loop containing nucleoside triphosphate hydrolase protein [Mycena rosella]